MTKPIRPEDISNPVKKPYIPEAVFSVFNDLIAQNYSDGISIVYQHEVVDLLTSDAFTFTKSQIFDNRWLDVEDDYRDNGWDVIFDKPGYNESYKAHFIFTKKK